MTTTAQIAQEERPNGPVVAALLAGGIGSAMLGLMTVLAEASPPFATSLNWYSPVGPLTGKSLVGVFSFFVSWIVMHFIFRGKNMNFARAVTIAFVLLALGLLFTFPPFFDLFAPE